MEAAEVEVVWRGGGGGGMMGGNNGRVLKPVVM